MRLTLALLAIAATAAPALAQDKGAEEQLRKEKERQALIERDRGAYDRREGAITEPSRVLEELHSMAQYDVRAAELALERGRSDETKKLAKDVLDESNQLDRKVVQAALELGVDLQPPVMASSMLEGDGSAGTEIQPKNGTATRVGGAYDRTKRREALLQLENLSKLEGADFDREYRRIVAACADGARRHLEPVHAALEGKEDDPSEKLNAVVGAFLEEARERGKELEKE